MQIIVLIRE